MSSIEKIRRLIKKRMETDDEACWLVDICWEQLTEALVEDFEVAKKFLLEECTADEASWVSEVYTDVLDLTNSQDFVDLFRACNKRFPEENKAHYMDENLDIEIRNRPLTRKPFKLKKLVPTTEGARAILKRLSEIEDRRDSRFDACIADLRRMFTRDPKFTEEFLLEECSPDEVGLASWSFTECVFATQSKMYLDIFNAAVQRITDKDLREEIQGYLGSSQGRVELP